MSQQNPTSDRVFQAHKQLLVKSMKDEAFRQELLSNPKGVLERELGITFPQGVNVQVHEDTSDTLHLVVPKRVPAQGSELTDAELEQVALGVPVTPAMTGGGAGTRCQND